MKLALVHDWLKEIGGAERVLIELHHIFPDAPIYVLFYDKEFVQKWLPGADIRASFLQRIPLISKFYVLFAWLMPVAVESFDLSEYDRVLSSSITFSKGLVLKPSTKHICYCYSPTRNLWDWHAESSRSSSWLRKLFNHFLRIWDRSAADRVDQFVAISSVVQKRIQKYYRRESIVIYPPVVRFKAEKNSHERPSQADGPRVERKIQQNFNAGRSENSSKPSFDALRRGLVDQSDTHLYLIVARLHRYKNIDVAIKAFNKLGYQLVIVGDGPDLSRLQKMAGKNIFFAGSVDDAALAAYYGASRALVMPQEEDFGLTPVEAMSFGKPVIALRRGGAIETLVEGVTGEFFTDPIPEAVADAVRRCNDAYAHYNSDTIRARAEKFSSDQFRHAILKLIE
jgi:glycosyltransferase involved in cell wall biosynthesis